ncbi:MAG: hypothetical protein FWD70_07125 [Desulfuromonadales bacterium]|nr:hypothetical protein [Desulfuromonadales bacterium]
MQYSAGNEPYKIFIDTVFVGEDLLITLSGGEKPHIGAVAAASPYPSSAEPLKLTASASVITYSGHKEDEVARSLALRVSSLLGVKTVVVAGIHIDNATENDLKLLLENVEKAVSCLLDDLKNSSSIWTA